MSTVLIASMIIVALFALAVGFIMGSGKNNRRYDAETDAHYAEMRAKMDAQSEAAERGQA